MNYMTIGIYDPYLDDLGGGEKYMMTIAQCLSQDHQVSLFWNNRHDLEELTERFFLDVTNISLKKNIFAPTVSFVERSRETKKYDVIIFLSDGSIPVVLSKKLFLHIQQPLEMIPQLSVKNKLKLSRVNGIFYNSEFTKSFNEKLFKQVKSSIIYPPVQILAKEVPKENIILHVGRFRVKNVGLEDFKKQGVMLDAFKEMVDQGLTGWKFVLAASVKKADEEKFHMLQERAKGYPIHFLVNKNNEALWESYNKAKIYWHASGYGEDLEKHPEFAEHFGISTVEAMGAGAVPVVINSGGQKEIVTDGKNGLLWDTIGELQAKTTQLMEEPTLLQSLSKKAQLRAKDFSKEVFCDAIKNLVG